GKRVGAIVAGLWRLTEAQIAEKFDLRAGTDYEVITIPGLLAGVTQVLAGTADYAMGWETDATLVREKYPDLKVVLSSADMRKDGGLTNIQVFGVRNEVPADVVDNTVKAFAEIAEAINKDPEAADAMGVKLLETQPDVYGKAVRAKRYNLVIRK